MATESPEVPAASEPLTPLDAEPVVETVNGGTSDSELMESLSALNDSYKIRERRRDELRAQLAAAQTDLEKEEILGKLRTVREEMSTLEGQFRSFALATDVSLYDVEEEESGEFDWQAELAGLAQPIISEIKAATAASRERAELRANIDLNEQKQQQATAAVKRLEEILAMNPPPELQERLEASLELWKGRVRDAENQAKAFTNQLELKEQEQAKLLENATKPKNNFVVTRGLNLLYGLLAFGVVFFGMRALPDQIMKLKPFQGKEKSFSGRLFTLVWTIVGTGSAIGAMLLVFNMVGDLFLLSLVMVFLLGLGWASVKTLPAFVDQFKMMLNMGALREGHVLVYDDVPWKVESISFQTKLVNSRLSGGVYQLPTKFLVGITGREPAPQEELFPTQTDDWIVTADGLFARVDYQCPGYVQLVMFGGAQKVIPTPEFLASKPTVLSTGFRINSSFGIDYQHISGATASIPEKMKAAVEKMLKSKVGEELQYVDVCFAEAAESSLNLDVRADFKGGAAANWADLPLWIQSTLVELSVQEGWSIPFPQLQLHTTPAS